MLPLFDLDAQSQRQLDPKNLMYFLVACFVCLLFLMCLHRTFDRELEREFKDNAWRNPALYLGCLVGNGFRWATLSILIRIKGYKPRTTSNVSGNPLSHGSSRRSVWHSSLAGTTYNLVVPGALPDFTLVATYAAGTNWHPLEPAARRA
jgi:hypothetical protein